MTTARDVHMGQQNWLSVRAEMELGQNLWPVTRPDPDAFDLVAWRPGSASVWYRTRKTSIDFEVAAGTLCHQTFIKSLAL